MHEQGTNTRVLGDGHRPEDGVLQQRRPKFEPLRTLRHGQPAQDQDGNGVWPVAANAAGRSLVGDRARCQGIKATTKVRLAPLSWLV